MSAAAAELTTTRYEGLIRTAQELYDAHEESGWRLANVIYDASEELRQQGLVITARGGDYERMTATKRVALDMDRHRMGAANVYLYRRVWEKFGDSARRHPTLTFGDHAALATRADPGPAVSALTKRRAALNAGEKPEFSSPNSAVAAARRGGRVARGIDNLANLGKAKHSLKLVIETNVWDYSDHQKVLNHVAEIQDLLDQIKAKPWNPDGAS